MNSPPPPPEFSGDLLDNRYRVGEVIGRGGHGVVYDGFDVQEGRDVAIKFLHPNIAAEPEFNVRMLREAQVASKLRGTAAIDVYALRLDGNGALFVVMELLRGKDLGAYLAQWESLGKFFPVADVPKIFGPIVNTLDQAHRMGIIHRDLKPGNIFVQTVATGGGVKLLDWGLVKVMKANPLTRDGMVAGSPSYIAPECWRGNPRELDHRIDVYSLGALIYRVLGGQPPFIGTLAELMQASLGAPRPSLYAIRSELPKDIDVWVQHALAIDPNQRFSNVVGLWGSLEQVLGY
jgi:serine/threonine-protein kinase